MKFSVALNSTLSLTLLQGINAVITLSQMIGTIILFYCPFYGQELYQSFVGQVGPPSLNWLCLLLLMCR